MKIFKFNSSYIAMCKHYEITLMHSYVVSVGFSTISKHHHEPCGLKDLNMMKQSNKTNKLPLLIVRLVWHVSLSTNYNLE